jgi:hypothetical protein
MAEPTSTGVLAAGMAGAGLAGILAGINPEAAVGSLCGALVFFSSNQELPIFRRLMFLAISFVMGILFAPMLAKAEFFGFGPIDLAGPSAFISSALVITVTLAAIKQRRGAEQPHG